MQAKAALSATHRESGNSPEPVLCGQNIREDNSKSHEACGQNKMSHPTMPEPKLEA